MELEALRMVCAFWSFIVLYIYAYCLQVSVAQQVGVKKEISDFVHMQKSVVLPPPPPPPPGKPDDLQMHPKHIIT